MCVHIIIYSDRNVQCTYKSSLRIYESTFNSTLIHVFLGPTLHDTESWRKKYIYKNLNARKDGVYWAPFIWITQSFINEPNGTVNENNVFALFFFPLHFVVPFICSALGSFLHISSNCYFTSLNLKLKVHHENEWRQQQIKEEKNIITNHFEWNFMFFDYLQFRFTLIKVCLFFSTYSSILSGLHLVFFSSFHSTLTPNSIHHTIDHWLV